MSKLLLLDGNSLLYRGFFAMRALSTASGQPVNAIYSLANMLLSLGREGANAVVCAWDTPQPTYRHIEFPAYKAQRAAPPDDLVAQRSLARELMAAFNIVNIEAPGWEADDIIGTLAEREKVKGVEVVIVTGDMDSAQLVDDAAGSVKVMSTVKGVSQTVVYDEATVFERYGISPKQTPDFKALKGDPSDNIPGAPGIGDKTATSLLTQFGTIEALIASIDDIKPPRIQQIVRDNSNVLLLYKRLATICRSCELPVDFSVGYDYPGLDSDACRALFERLEFQSLLRRLPASVKPNKSSAPHAPVENPAPVSNASGQFTLDFEGGEAPVPPKHPKTLSLNRRRLQLLRSFPMALESP